MYNRKIQRICPGKLPICNVLGILELTYNHDKKIPICVYLNILNNQNREEKGRIYIFVNKFTYSFSFTR